MGVQRFVHWTAVVWASLLLGLLGFLGEALLRDLAARPAVMSAVAHRGTTVHGGLAILPLAAQGVVSGTLGADEGAYRVHASGGGLEAVNPAQHLRARFDRSGVLVGSGRARLGLGLRAVGYGDSLRSVDGVVPRARGNRVAYARAGVSEWYANGPLGLEQGFTIARAPADGTAGGRPVGPLTLSIALSGNVRGSLAAGGYGDGGHGTSGQSLTFSGTGGQSLRYGGLVVSDARGHALHSWLQLRNGRVLLRIDARGARYPLRIDPFVQQGSLTGKSEESEIGKAGFGDSVALSSDGNTALIGGPTDSLGVGAAWVFTRSEGKWTQQGAKLTGGSEESGKAGFGVSVALSSDGNSALVGGPDDNKEAGAAWVFTRSEGKWTKQGAKLTGEGEIGNALFGYAVALSSEGNTALIGGLGDDEDRGAAWVFTRSEGKWTQQAKFRDSAEDINAQFGRTVALSGEGTTALIAGPTDRGRTGSAWVFTRSEGKWTQQGNKLTPAEYEGNSAWFGITVALSSDGNTALVSGPGFNPSPGAAWVFTRSEGKWAQQGSALTDREQIPEGKFGIGTLSPGGNMALINGDGAAWVFMRVEGKWIQQGSRFKGREENGTAANIGGSLALSSEGSTALIGGDSDEEGVGAAYVFTRSEPSYGCVNPGEPTVQQSCVGDVNAATGDMEESQTDLAVGGRGPGLHVTRTYNSEMAAEQTEVSPFGYGWTGPYSAHLMVNVETKTATVYQENGSAVKFAIEGESFTAEPWVQATLEKEGNTYIYTLPDQTKFEFNYEGVLTKEVDRNGNAITLAYNSKGELETATDGDGRKLTFVYNSEGEVESIKDPLGHVVKYTYKSGELASVTLPGETSASWKFEYDSSREMTKLTDGRGNSTTIEYESGSPYRVKSQTDPLKHERKLKYAAVEDNTETDLTEPNGSETVERFNEMGEPTKVTEAASTSIAATTEDEYNSSFDLIAETNPDKHTTKHGYDSTDDQTSETDPNGDETKWTYDGKHDVETITTPKGEKTTIKRNSNGDPEVIEQPIGSEAQKTTLKYDGKGDVTEETDPLKNTTKYTYDEAGDLESETDPEGDKRTWEYNKDSLPTAEVSPRGNVEGGKPSEFTTKIERDEQNRPVKVTDPLGHATKYKYDADGDAESVTDGNGHTTKSTYNADDEQTAVEEPNKTIVETGYDSEGKATSRTDGNKHTWEYKRNLLEEVTEEINPLKQATKKKYDEAGNLETLEDHEKHTTTYKYDESSRPIEVSYSTGKPSAIKYEYDKDGDPLKMTDGTGETKNTYDALDRLTEMKNGGGKIVKYEYNLANEPTKITYPNAKAVTREYDKDGRLAKVTDWNSKATSFKYSPDSQLTATVFPSGAEDEDTSAYNDADQMTEVKMKNGATSLGSLAYERDSDGQVKKTTTTVLPGPAISENKYDENNRLAESNKLSDEYDKANNPTKLEGSGAYSYNEADELKEGPELKYTYNEDGQRTETKPSKGPAITYGYNQAGNLTSVKRPKEEPLAEINDSYTYDGNNLRQSQTLNGVTTHLTWDTAEELPLTLTDETNSYIYGPENLPIEQISSGGTTLYLHHDQQGSTRLLTGSTGKTETAYTYNPYGTLNATTGTATTPLRYDGQYTNTDSGLIYLRARTYDPSTAQFLSVDPAEAETGEPYSYGGDNPVNGGDPSGLDTWGGCTGAFLKLQYSTLGTHWWDRGALGTAVHNGEFLVCVIRDSNKKWAVTVTSGAKIDQNTIVDLEAAIGAWVSGDGLELVKRIASAVPIGDLRPDLGAGIWGQHTSAGSVSEVRGYYHSRTDIYGYHGLLLHPWFATRRMYGPHNLCATCRGVGIGVALGRSLGISHVAIENNSFTWVFPFSR